MPTPYAKILVSVNGGANTSGGIDVPSAATIALSPESTVGWTQGKWEFYDYPEGWATPAGWTLADDGTIYYVGFSPPAITLPANTVIWGVWMLRLRVNEQVISDQIVAGLLDEATALSMLSPSGLRDTGAREGSHFTTATTRIKNWIRSYQRNLRAIEASPGGGGGSPAGSVGDIQTKAGASTFGAITPGAGIATFLATPSGANLAAALTTALPNTKGGTGQDSSGWSGLALVTAGTWSALTLAAGVATFLGTPSSANLRAAVTDETGTGALVFANTPTLVTPVLGAATATSVADDGSGVLGIYGSSNVNIGAVGTTHLIVGSFVGGVRVQTTLKLADSNNTASYVFVPADLAADRNIALPLLAGNTTMAVLDHAQTFSATQTFTAGVRTGAAPSTTVTGVGLSNNTAVSFRDAANAANIRALYCSTIDDIVLGDTANTGYLNIQTGATILHRAAAHVFETAAGASVASLTSSDLTLAGAQLTLGSAGPTVTKGTGVPATSPANGSIFLRTDGTSSTGIYTRQGGAWSAVGGGGAVGGADTQVLFNDGGAEAGEAGLTYAKATDVLSVVGGVAVGPSASVALTGFIRLASTGGGVSQIVAREGGVDYPILRTNSTTSYVTVSNIGLNTTLTGNNITYEAAGGGVHLFYCGASPVFSLTSTGWQLGGTADHGGGSGVIGIDNAATNPSTSPTGGIVLFASAGNLRQADSDGVIDQFGRGHFVQAMADANQTPSASSAAAGTIETTGAITANRQLTLPTPSTGTAYFRIIRNNCTGAFSVEVKKAGAGGILVGNGKTAIIVIDQTGARRVTADV